MPEPSPATGEVQRSTVQLAGGITVRARWAGSGRGAEVFALSEAGGRLEDHGALAASDPSRLCRAELRVESPTGSWTARLASPIFDQPSTATWDVPGLLVVGYGFVTYAFDARTGALRWSHRSRTPLVAILASSRLEHVVVQSEVETFAIDATGDVRWRVAHSDVVTEASLVGGRLVLSSFSGERLVLDPRTGTSVREPESPRAGA